MNSEKLTSKSCSQTAAKRRGPENRGRERPDRGSNPVLVTTLLVIGSSFLKFEAHRHRVATADNHTDMFTGPDLVLP